MNNDVKPTNGQSVEDTKKNESQTPEVKDGTQNIQPSNTNSYKPGQTQPVKTTHQPSGGAV